MFSRARSKGGLASGRVLAVLSAVLFLETFVLVLVTRAFWKTCTNQDPQTAGFSTTVQDSSLHCPEASLVQMNKDVVNYSKIEVPMTPAMLAIERHQNPVDCSTAKFLVWKFPNAKSTRNIGSIYTNIMRYMPHAFATNRVLLLDSRNWSLADCPSRSAECYFLPVSHCKVEDLDSILDDPSETFTVQRGQVSLQKFENYTLHHADARVWRLPQDWHFGGEFWDEMWPMGAQQHPCRFLSATLLYLMRPQPWVKDAVQRKIAGSFPEDFDPSRAIGLPIRASDKCFGHSLAFSAGGEMHCHEEQVHMYLDFAEKVREFDRSVDTILLTSEDISAVIEVMQMAADRSKNLTGTEWKIVLNKGDENPQGSGSATYFVAKSKMEGGPKLSEQLVGGLSSLYFQLRSRYLLTNVKSSYSILIHLMHLEDSITFSSSRLRFEVPSARDVLASGRGRVGVHPGGPLKLLQC